jgi:selenide, water dikinase
MSPKDLAQVLRHLPPIMNPKVLVGMNTADDAAVYKVRDDLAVAFTVDYFTPVVDDPYDFGQIAAANAMSDCYAMGVQPSIALNIVGFPVKTLPMHVLDRILEGGADKATEGRVSIVGGHTIDDSEPKYGMAVIGFTHPDVVITNSEARKGDALVLTKPLGIGIITTAIKHDEAPPSAIKRAIELMKTLNRDASLTMTEVGVDACTDVTGFGLLGHLWEMCTASKVGATVYLPDVPVLSEAWKIAEAGTIPGGAYSNREYVAADVSFDPKIGDVAQLVLCDPQTSGGLLIAVPPEKADELVDSLKVAGTPVAAIIGEITEDLPGRIKIVG